MQNSSAAITILSEATVVHTNDFFSEALNLRINSFLSKHRNLSEKTNTEAEKLSRTPATTAGCGNADGTVVRQEIAASAVTDAAALKIEADALLTQITAEILALANSQVSSERYLEEAIIIATKIFGDIDLENLMKILLSSSNTSALYYKTLQISDHDNKAYLKVTLAGNIIINCIINNRQPILEYLLQSAPNHGTRLALLLGCGEITDYGNDVTPCESAIFSRNWRILNFILSNISAILQQKPKFPDNQIIKISNAIYLYDQGNAIKALPLFLDKLDESNQIAILKTEHFINPYYAFTLACKNNDMELVNFILATLKNYGAKYDSMIIAMLQAQYCSIGSNLDYIRISNYAGFIFAVLNNNLALMQLLITVYATQSGKNVQEILACILEARVASENFYIDFGLRDNKYDYDCSMPYAVFNLAFSKGLLNFVAYFKANIAPELWDKIIKSEISITDQDINMFDINIVAFAYKIGKIDRDFLQSLGLLEYAAAAIKSSPEIDYIEIDDSEIDYSATDDIDTAAPNLTANSESKNFSQKASITQRSPADANAAAGCSKKVKTAQAQFVIDPSDRAGPASAGNNLHDLDLDHRNAAANPLLHRENDVPPDVLMLLAKFEAGYDPNMLLQESASAGNNPGQASEDSATRQFILQQKLLFQSCQQAKVKQVAHSEAPKPATAGEQPIAKPAVPNQKPRSGKCEQPGQDLPRVTQF